MCEYELEKRIYVMDATIRHQTIKLLGAAPLFSGQSHWPGTSLKNRTVESQSVLQSISDPKGQGKKGSSGSSPPAVLGDAQVSTENS